MAKALNILIDQPFTSDHDDDETKTTWFYRTLTALEWLEVTQTGAVNYQLILEKGLTGWKDFIDGEGNQIPFALEEINRIPPFILQDIAFKIQEDSMLSEDERKNS